MDKKKIEYRYEFANGDVMTVSISDDCGMSEDEIRKWVPFLKDMDRLERNNNQTERRRHCSLGAFNPLDERLAAKDDGFDTYRADALWKELTRHLTEREKRMSEMFFRTGYSAEEIAGEFELTKEYVQYLIRRIRRKILKGNKTTRFWPLP